MASSGGRRARVDALPSLGAWLIQGCEVSLQVLSLVPGRLRRAELVSSAQPRWPRYAGAPAALILAFFLCVSAFLSLIVRLHLRGSSCRHRAAGWSSNLRVVFFIYF